MMQDPREMKNVNGDGGDWGLSMESFAGMQVALSYILGLDDIIRVMIRNVAATLDSLKPSLGSCMKIEPAKWLRQSVTAATINPVYGPQNPFKNLGVAEASGRVFGYIIRWNASDACDANVHARQFERNLMALLVGILPSATAHKGLASRAKVVKAFEHYLNTNRHEQASILMKNRYEASTRNGISVTDIARFEVE